MKPLTKDQISEWQNAYNHAVILENVIIDRVGYVVSVWMKTFGGKLTNWYFGSAREGEVGNFVDHFGGDSVYSIYTECKPHPAPNDGSDMVIIDKFGGEWGWDSSIPLRWLFEDCEDEIIQGKILYEEKLKKKKEDAAVKKSLKKKLDESLANQAKAKLTKEELAALKKVL